jgi:DNA invertase Pin-like site-specific DNA recombinase
VTVWCEDWAVSGTAEPADRPGAACALTAIETGEAEGVVAMTLDRLARGLHLQEAFLGAIWGHGGRVFTVDGGEVQRDDPSDPTRTLIRQVLGAVSQFERALITNRMSRGRAAKAEAGGFAGGGVPYGMRADGGEVVADPDEAAVLARVRAMREAGQSLRVIADCLNRDRVPTRRGGDCRWTAASIRRLVDPDVRRIEAGMARRRRAAT